MLHRTGPLDQGVSVARRLFAAGLTLKQAHDAINRLAELSWSVCAVANTEDLGRLASDLAPMNVELRQKRPVSGQAVDIAAMRTRRGLSQREYADLLGLDVVRCRTGSRGAIAPTRPRSA